MNPNLPIHPFPLKSSSKKNIFLYGEEDQEYKVGEICVHILPAGPQKYFPPNLVNKDSSPETLNYPGLEERRRRRREVWQTESWRL